MNILVTIVILSTLHLTCFSLQSEQKNGFCVLTITSREPKWEPYTFTYRTFRQDRCGWRYCQREVIEEKTEDRLVYQDVETTRVECCHGYIKKNIHGNVFDCEPVCEPACVWGECVEAGNCTCYHGYEHVSSHECGPICDPGCQKGAVCVAPQTCACTDGYRKVNSSYCEPICYPPCIDGLCTAPNECTCTTGFNKSSTDPYVCEPICTEDCVNSVCVAYNECECFQGYKRDSDNPFICSPFCSLECISGKCTSPNTCTCDEGYILSNTTWNNCEPNCTCSNGYCSEPNRCTCFANYTLKADGDCDPVCDGCVNAECTSPYVCECLEGFKRFSDTVCEPECTECENGVCTEPEVCTCYKGYQNFFGTCEPVCSHGCANGACVAPERCTCVDDSEQVEDNVCFPVCRNNCTNCTLSDDCLRPTRTRMDISYSQTSMSLKARFNLGVNCSALMTAKTLCELNSTDEETCDSIVLECSPIVTIHGAWKLLCVLTYQNGTEDDIYSEVLSDLATINITSADQKVAATILVPPDLFDQGGCELCTEFYNTSLLNETNAIRLKVHPCHLKVIDSLIEVFYLLAYIIAATLFTIVTTAVVACIHTIKSRKRSQNKDFGSNGSLLEFKLINKQPNLELDEINDPYLPN